MVCTGALIILITLGVLERVFHYRALYSIPLRIHVNGSRGKSSVTRLVAGALREAGMTVIARTTGTAARHILDDGSEEPIVRRGRPRILELTDTVRLARSRKADAIVVECMAIHPDYQEASETMLLRSTHAIITNVRDDHLDVMGPSLRDAARAMGGTIPRGGVLVTSERRCLDVLARIAERKNCRLVQPLESDRQTIEGPDVQLSDFSDNFEVVLALCRELGIPRDTALRGMRVSGRDPGIVTIYRLETSVGGIFAVNAFAANDPESTAKIIEKLGSMALIAGKVVIIYNHRTDRQQRALSFAEMIAGIQREYGLERLVLLGPATRPLVPSLRRAGVDPRSIVRVAAFRDPARFIEGVVRPLALSPPAASPAAAVATVIGIGNIAGAGHSLLSYWETKGLAYA
jgi:gamma-polyglutamate synthase